MTRTAKLGNKMSALPSTPWAQLKKGYQTLQGEPQELSGESDCDSNVNTTTYEGDSDMSDPTLKVTKNEKLKTKRKMDKVTSKIKKTLTNRMLRKQLDELEMTPLLTDTSSSNLDRDDDSSEKEDKFKKYSSNKIKRVKMKSVRQTASQTHNSVEEAVCLIQSDMDVDSKRSDSNSPAAREVTLSSEKAADEATTRDVSASKNKQVTKARKLHSKTKEKGQLEAVVDEMRMKRAEARRLRRQKRKVCFNCRQPGHHVSECKQSHAEGTGVCFKCGANNHTSKRCRARVTEGEYPYAKCFICGEVGHLSRACPENPKGLYPHGGSCKFCGSVEHFGASCPEKFNSQGRNTRNTDSFPLVMAGSASIDAENFDGQPSSETKTRVKGTQKTTRQTKVVTF